MNTPFNIGDDVWIARVQTEEKRVTCPDCFGKKYLTVILGDDSTVQIDCAECSHSFERPCGTVVVHEVSASVEIRTITGMDFRSEGNTMIWCDCQGFELENCFATQEAAQARADELLATRRAEEAKAFACKEKPERTWAWNTTYHRQRLKQALKDAEYHKAKLEVCKLHSKDAETAKTT